MNLPRSVPIPGLTAGLALALAACSSNPVEPTLESRLLGRWDWVQAEGGIAGSVITPETEGFAMQLVFTEPNRIELLRGVSSERTTYEFLPAEDLGDISIPRRLRYAEPILGFEEQQVGFDLGGRLVLIDACCDGFVYTWSRTETRID